MKTLKKNVQEFKEYMLEQEAQHTSIKKIANMSSNNDEWHPLKIASARNTVKSKKYEMRVLYTAYYIVKHNLNEDTRLIYLRKLAEQFKKWYKNDGTPDYNYVSGDSYFTSSVYKLVDKFSNEKDEINN